MKRILLALFLGLSTLSVQSSDLDLGNLNLGNIGNIGSTGISPTAMKAISDLSINLDISLPKLSALPNIGTIAQLPKLKGALSSIKMPAMKVSVLNNLGKLSQLDIPTPTLTAKLPNITQAIAQGVPNEQIASFLTKMPKLPALPALKGLDVQLPQINIVGSLPSLPQSMPMPSLPAVPSVSIPSGFKPLPKPSAVTLPTLSDIEGNLKTVFSDAQALGKEAFNEIKSIVENIVSNFPAKPEPPVTANCLYLSISDPKGIGKNTAFETSYYQYLAPFYQQIEQPAPKSTWNNANKATKEAICLSHMNQELQQGFNLGLPTTYEDFCKGGLFEFIKLHKAFESYASVTKALDTTLPNSYSSLLKLQSSLQNVTKLQDLATSAIQLPLVIKAVQTNETLPGILAKTTNSLQTLQGSAQVKGSIKELQAVLAKLQKAQASLPGDIKNLSGALNVIKFLESILCGSTNNVVNTPCTQNPLFDNFGKLDATDLKTLTKTVNNYLQMIMIFEPQAMTKANANSIVAALPSINKALGTLTSTTPANDVKSKIGNIHNVVIALGLFIKELQADLSKLPASIKQITTDLPTMKDDVTKLLASKTKIEGLQAQLGPQIAQIQKSLGTSNATDTLKKLNSSLTTVNNAIKTTAATLRGDGDQGKTDLQVVENTAKKYAGTLQSAYQTSIVQGKAITATLTALNSIISSIPDLNKAIPAMKKALPLAQASVDKLSTFCAFDMKTKEALHQKASAISVDGTTYPDLVSDLKKDAQQILKSYDKTSAQKLADNLTSLQTSLTNAYNALVASSANLKKAMNPPTTSTTTSTKG